MPRVAVEVTVQSPMGPLRIATTHLEYYSDVQRRAQAARLRSLHDEACQRAMHPGAATAALGPFDATPQSTHAILCGDFNFPPENPAYLDVLDRSWPPEKEAPITFVVIPEYVARSWWERILYNQSARRLRAALLGRPHTVVVNVPYRREDPSSTDPAART